MDKIFKVIIIDDEAHARQNIRLLLAGRPDFEVVLECGDGRSAINAIKEHRPDLIFLDIQMPEVNGLEVVGALPSDRRPYIIFTTAYDQYAIKAFEINALDYLLKPLNDERFESSLQRFRSYFQKDKKADLQHQLSALLETMSAAENKKGFLKKISVRNSQRIVFLDVADIFWIEADNQYVKIHLQQRSHLLRQSLSQLEKVLDPQHFYRTHRSAIVNLELVDHMKPYFKGDYWLFLKNGQKVKLSRNRTQGLKSILNW